MVQLTHKQTDVGSVLHDGSCLLQQTSLSDDERRTVDNQLTLLSNLWEELRLKAMDRQARFARSSLAVCTQSYSLFVKQTDCQTTTIFIRHIGSNTQNSVVKEKRIQTKKRDENYKTSITGGARRTATSLIETTTCYH